MRKLPQAKRRVTFHHMPFIGGILVLGVLACGTSFAYERYNDGCVECHGAFTDDTSTKGSVFPSGSKHTMHNGTSAMNTECNLCHSTGDQRNPFIGASKGTTANPVGLGCTGCHMTAGLRTHHLNNGVVDSNGDNCSTCHQVGTPSDENVKPPYYGTVDTLADNACNDVLASNTNENWTVGDFVGLDNDGDNLYDLADFDCGPPYQVAALAIEGSNVRVSWETVGGRRDMLQSTPSLTESFSDVGSALDIAGVGILTTNSVEVGGVTASNRFYRIRYAP